MAKKTIDVTLASMRSTGKFNASPKGAIRAQAVRAVDDEEVHQNEVLYLRVRPEEPMHPSGAFSIHPGKSLTFNVTKRLTLDNTQPLPNDMLIFSRDLEEDELHRYQGSFNRKVRFDEIDGFTTVTCDYSVISGGEAIHKIIASYTVNLIESSG